MRNKNLIFIISLLFGTLVGCGQKGPLYEAPPPTQNQQPDNDETK